MTAAEFASSHRGPGRPPAGSEDKRERILDESLRLFAQRGYSGTSLADIARAADISKAGLLHHFPSKDALFAAVLDRRDRESGGPPSGAAGLEDLLDSWIDLIRHNITAPAGVALYTAMSSAVIDARHPAHQWFSGHLAGTIKTMTTALEAAKSTGQLAADTPSESLARALVALSDGLQVQWLCARADRTRPGEEGDADRESGDSASNDPDEPILPYDTDMVAETRAAVDALITPWLASDSALTEKDRRG